MKRIKQTKLDEFTFAKRVAQGATQRDAYIEIFGGDISTPKGLHNIDAKASALAKRQDVAELIADEISAKEQKVTAEERDYGVKIRLRMLKDVSLAQERGEGLKPNVVRAAEVALKSTGQFAPEEHILKNGGSVPGAFVPRGVEGMSEDDLKGIIEAEGHSVSPIGGAEKKGE